MTVARKTSDTSESLSEILHIGRILGAHGLQGELKILPLSDDLMRFKELKDCLIVSADEKERVPAIAAGARFSNTVVLLRLQGVVDRNSADALKGKTLSVSREHAVKLPPDTWFVCDLLGCEVYDHTRGLLGVVSDVLATAAHDVYTVQLKGQKDLLFPALKMIIQKVDIAIKRIDVVLPDGLFEIYRENK